MKRNSTRGRRSGLSTVSFRSQYSRFIYDPKPRQMWLLHPKFPAYFMPGLRGSGKSTTQEWALEWYYQHNYLVIDAWSAPDFEGAYWAIPDIVKIFSWRRVPGKQEAKLRTYLKARFQACAPWIDNATFAKTDDGNTITISSQEHVLKIILTMKSNRADVVYNRKKIWEFVVKSKVEEKDGPLKLVYDINPARKDWWKIRRVGYPVLILVPRTTTVTQKDPLCKCGIPIRDHDSSGEIPCKGPDELIKFVFDDTPLDKVLMTALEEKRIIVFNRGFYHEHKDAFRRLAQILHQLPYLIIQAAIPPNTPIALGFRELSNIAPQGLKSEKGDWETETKRRIQSLIRDARHHSIVMFGDFQRSQDIAKAIAAQRDTLIFKRTTPDLMPEEYVDLFFEIEKLRRNARENLDNGLARRLPSMSQLKDWQAYALFPDNHFQLIETGMPGFHHKESGEQWSAITGIRIKFDAKKVPRSVEKAKKQLEKEDERQKRLDALKEAGMLKSQGWTWRKLGDKYGMTEEQIRTAYRRAVESGLISASLSDLSN